MFRSHVVETERSKKKTLEVFSPAEKPFQTGLSPNDNKQYGGERFYYGKKPTNRDRHSAQFGGR